MGGQEALGMTYRGEPFHRPFPLAGGLMRALSHYSECVAAEACSGMLT